MKTIIFILIILSFIQTAILPLNLVLIILIARALVRTDKSNLFLAFGFGLLISHLSLEPIGIKSLIYLVLIQLTQLLSKSRFSASQFLIIPVVAVFSSINLITAVLLNHQSVQLLPEILIESFIALPIFFLVRVWEERFVVRKGIKLRV